MVYLEKTKTLCHDLSEYGKEKLIESIELELGCSQYDSESGLFKAFENIKKMKFRAGDFVYI